MADIDPSVLQSLRRLAADPAIEAAVTRVRDATAALRWHETLRRRVPEAAAESRVRGAWASARLDGVTVTLEALRAMAMGAAGGQRPEDLVAGGSLAATSEVERLAGVVTTAPFQALARLHTAAMASVLPPEGLGRPRISRESSAELTMLGVAPPADQVAVRLAAITAAIAARSAGVPVVVIAAVAHGEILATRPFQAGNGIVARAFERSLLIGAGVDSTAVGVPEAGFERLGVDAYLTGATAYVHGGERGVQQWILLCARAYAEGAAQGVQICDAIRAGRLSGPDGRPLAWQSDATG